MDPETPTELEDHSDDEADQQEEINPLPHQGRDIPHELPRDIQDQEIIPQEIPREIQDKEIESAEETETESDEYEDSDEDYLSANEAPNPIPPPTNIEAIPNGSIIENGIRKSSRIKAQLHQPRNLNAKMLEADEPHSYQEAVSCQKAQEWKLAIQKNSNP
jgi:hypothetical protein